MLHHSKYFIIAAICCLTALIGGCDIMNYALSDVSGWNLSACTEEYSVCWNLFWDNRSHIQGGATAVENLLGGTQ
jgi:hypothetical protein